MLADPGITLTVRGMSGKVLFGPTKLARPAAVREVRAAISASQPALPRAYPWQPQITRKVVLMRAGSPGSGVLSDDAVLDEDQAELEAVVTDVEEQREGLQVEDVFQLLREHYGELRALYVHGSWVNGNKEPADVDLFAVVDTTGRGQQRRFQGGCLENDDGNLYGLDTCFGKVQVAILTVDDFWLRLQSMDPTVWFLLSLPDSFVLRRFSDERLSGLAVDRTLLEASVLGVADVKFLEATLTPGAKAVFYAFRILELGRQLALNEGKIVDFTAANKWYDRALQVEAAVNEVLKENGVDASSRTFFFEDLIPAFFARDFEAQRQRCLDAFAGTADLGGTDAAPPSGHCTLSRELIGEDVCHLCCGHAFQPVCLIKHAADQVASAKPHFWWNDDRIMWSRLTPKVSCPTCQKSVRVDMDRERTANLTSIIRERPLDGAAAPLLILYSNTINFHTLFSYTSWDGSVTEEVAAAHPRGFPPEAKRLQLATAL